MHAVYWLPATQFHRYQQHLLSLDQPSRRMRFGFSISDDGIKNICDNMRSQIGQHVIFVIENHDLEVVAAGHVATVGGNMELAFSVLSEYRRQNMADALMKRCLNWCQNRGYKSGYMVCLRENDAMRSLARKHGLSLTSQDGDTEALVTLPPASMYTVISESIDNGLGVLDHVGKLQSNFASRLRF